MPEINRTYWVAINKETGLAMGSNRVATPRLYLGKKAAKAAQKGYWETEDKFNERVEIIPVRIVRTDA